MAYTPRKPGDSDDLERAPDLSEETQPTAGLSQFENAAPTAGLPLEAAIAPHMEDVLHPKDVDLAARRADRHAAFKATTPSKPLRIRGDTITNIANVLDVETPPGPSKPKHGFSFAPASPLTVPKDTVYFDTNKARALNIVPKARAELEAFDERMQRMLLEPSIAGLSGAKVRDQSSEGMTVFGYATTSPEYPRKLQLFLEFHPRNAKASWRIVGVCDVPRFPIHHQLFNTEKLSSEIESYMYGIKLRWSQYKSGPESL